MSTAADASPTEPTEPTAAERVRSVVAAAHSLSLAAGGREYDLIDVHAVRRRGRIALHPGPDSPLAALVREAPRGGVAALLEFTDIAPVAVRTRVRAQVAIWGRLAPDRGGDVSCLRLDTARVTLRTGNGPVDVGLHEWAAATPDPLALEEAALLTHLVDAHGDMVAGLLALAGPRVRRGWTRVAPVAVDRHGITLRCDYPDGYADVRLGFPEPAGSAAEAGEKLSRLLMSPAAAAPRAHRSRRS
ncbi:DUF2470 domain-containing protein [Streptomyces sp. NPDC093225]|uniref:DUF2470 domain-containing protein n=1 Tax=Streptomyces sp. NPDC093225 TaxID=3366034 RepID=UPI0038184DF1